MIGAAVAATAVSLARHARDGSARHVCGALRLGIGARDLVRGRARASLVRLGRFLDGYGCGQGAPAQGARLRSWECDWETRDALVGENVHTAHGDEIGRVACRVS